ncbi:MAG: GNAT family N-acetyltransferase [Actinomycetota bacterium]
MTPPTIRAHGDVDDELRDAWRKLAVGETASGYLSQPEWFDSVLASLPNARACVLTVHDGDELTALVASRVDRVRLPLRVGYKQVLPISVTTLQVMEGGILGDVRDVDAIFDGLDDAAAAAGASVVTFPRLALDHPFSVSGRRARRPWLRTPEPRNVHHISHIGEGGYDELMAGSKSTRKRVRKYERTLERDHEVTLDVFTTRDELEDFLVEATPIAETSYQFALGSSLNTPGEADRLRRLAALGWFRGYILRVDGDAWTFDYGILHGSTFTAVATAYRQEHAKKRPGNIALARWIDDLGANAVTAIDWGPGDAEYKRSLSSISTDEQALLLNRRTPTGALVALTGLLVDAIDRAGRWMVERTDGLQSVKTWFRRRLRSSE